jgi:hypothetical protein
VSEAAMLFRCAEPEAKVAPTTQQLLLSVT